MNNNSENEIQELLDGAQKILDASFKNEIYVRNLIAKLNDISEHVESAGVEINGNINKLVNHAQSTLDIIAKDTAEIAAKQLQEKFFYADQAALKAAEHYERVAKRLNVKFALVSLSIALLIAASIWFVMLKTLPSREDISNREMKVSQLNQTIEKMQANIKVLEAKGGKVQFTNCRDSNGYLHLCFRTDTIKYPESYMNDGDKNVTWMIPYGY